MSSISRIRYRHIPSYTTRRPRVPADALSIASRRSRASWRRKGQRPRAGPASISAQEFFAGIAANRELGKDYLREMTTPICTSQMICLPINVADISHGRCVDITPFGHNLIMHSHCPTCCAQHAPEIPNEFASVPLLFFSQADRVVDNKLFYASLYTSSMEAVHRSFRQPGLLYTYVLVARYFKEFYPVFTWRDNALAMTILFKFSGSLHLSADLLRPLADYLTNYQVTIDLSPHGFTLTVYPRAGSREEAIAVNEQQICTEIVALECSDELRNELANAYRKISGPPRPE